MAGGFTVVSDWLGIIELRHVCATARARSLALFTTLGGWITSTPDGERQRLYVEACHRHAWHAELWAGRAPSIPGGTVDPEPGRDVAGNDERHAWYADTLAEIRDELASLRRRVDPVLDPSTARTIQLVDADLVDLAERARQTR